MMLAVILFVYSFVQFVKFVVKVLSHDVGSMVYGDYNSTKRDAQRGSAIWTFFKSFAAFIAAGWAAYLLM